MANTKKLASRVTECLWAIDSNHSQINNAFTNKKCKGLPGLFGTIYSKQYRDWVAQKKRKPSLSSENLGRCADELFNILSAWDRVKCPSDKFFAACRKLAEALRSYADCIMKSKEKVAEYRSTATVDTQRSIESAFTMPTPIQREKHVKDKYRKVNNAIANSPFYEPIVLDNDFDDYGIPESRQLRYLWFKNMALSHR